MTRWRAALRWLALGLLCLLSTHESRAQGAPPDALPEYVLKAGFLYNFAKYVEWPAASFASAEAPISIGVVGSDPFGPDLERTLGDKTVNNRRFQIRRYTDLAQVEPVHILFIPQTERERVVAILKRVERLPVLTVGEDETFPEGGGVVAILIRESRPSLHINPQAAETQQLAIAPKLLRIATIVTTSAGR
jgi:hypothetical protein